MPNLPRNQACIPCRNARVRCNAGRPRCDKCIHHNRQCTYLPGAYENLMLQARVSELEKQIADAQSSLSNRSAAPPLARQKPPAFYDSRPLLRALQRWDVSTPLPVALRQGIVDVFLQYQHLFRLQLNPSRLRAAAERSDGDADALHPALLNSICLLVCNIGDSDMKPFEDLFLSRTCETSLDSFRYTDKLDDPVAAFTIQIVSMIRTDDVLWAFDLSTALVSFAVACGFPFQQDTTQPAYQPFLEPPRDIAQIIERDNIWWSIYCLHLTLSHAMSRPSVIPDNVRLDATTGFPSAFNNDQGGMVPRGESIQTILTSPQSPIAPTNPLLLFAKAQWFFELGLQLIFDTQRDESLPSYWSRHPSYCAAATRFMESLPDIGARNRRTSSTQTPLSYFCFPSAADPILLEAHIAIASSILLLNSVYSHPMLQGNSGASVGATLHVGDLLDRVDDACLTYTCVVSIASRLKLFVDFLCREMRKNPSSTSPGSNSNPTPRWNLKRIVKFFVRLQAVNPVIYQHFAAVVEQARPYM